MHHQSNLVGSPTDLAIEIRILPESNYDTGLRIRRLVHDLSNGFPRVSTRSTKKSVINCCDSKWESPTPKVLSERLRFVPNHNLQSRSRSAHSNAFETRRCPLRKPPKHALLRLRAVLLLTTGNAGFVLAYFWRSQ
jgi:hypothetical protein